MDKRRVAVLVLGAVVAAKMGAEAQTAAIAPQTTATAGASVTSKEQYLALHAQENRARPAKVSRRRQHKAERAFLMGARTIEKNDPGTAKVYFMRAHELDPNNGRYPVSAEIAQQHVVTQLVQHAKSERLLGHEDESLTAVEAAIRLDPQNPTVAGYVATLAADASAAQPTMPAIEYEAATPVVLAPQQGRRTFDLRTDKRSLILQILNAYGIRATIDQSVSGQQVHFDAVDIDFADAADLIKLATDTFFVPLDSLHVMVAADTKENRGKYERQGMETIYFPGLSAVELTDMGNIAHNVFGVEHSVIDASKGTMILRASEPELDALNETYAELLGGKSELLLEVRVYEIDKTKATNVGVILPSSTTVFNVPSEVNSILSNNASLISQIIASDPALAGNYPAIIAALIASGALTGTVFNSPFAVLGGGLTETGLAFNGVSVNMLLDSSDVRSLDQLQLRVSDQEEATIRSGERYPIMTSSYSGLASSSPSNIQTIPQVQYEDLGLTLKMRPHIGLESEVSLNLDLKLSSLAGSSLNGIPILANRQYTGVVSLRPEDSALVVSAVSKQESLEITGVPGLSDLPGLSGATNRQDTKDIMELAIMITPHVVRLAHQETMGPMLLLPQH